MRIIKPSYEILTDISVGGVKELTFIEDVARTCYLSHSKGDFESTKKFIKGLIEKGHHAMLEHSILTVRFIFDRGASHEDIRHRNSAFAQESTRWCNYSLNKFESEITVIEPNLALPNYEDQEEAEALFESCVAEAEFTYMKLIELGVSPQEARSVLPTCLKTTLVHTANFREWGHILKLRTAPDAHPQIRKVMINLHEELKERIPVIFDDLIVY